MNVPMVYLANHIQTFLYTKHHIIKTRQHFKKRSMTLVFDTPKFQIFITHFLEGSIQLMITSFKIIVRKKLKRRGLLKKRGSELAYGLVEACRGSGYRTLFSGTIHQHYMCDMQWVHGALQIHEVQEIIEVFLATQRTTREFQLPLDVFLVPLVVTSQ